MPHSDINDNRPDPDALLAHARAEDPSPKRGKLKVFFGYAPGVGKTYAMLEAARKEGKAGIDVYSTLNVQHLESLNDIIARVTGVTVRETVPDSVFDAAHEVELVDISPDDLIERLQEGKVYLPDQAARAVENFFRKGNL